jgi:hypothetical protein
LIISEPYDVTMTQRREAMRECAAGRSSILVLPAAVTVAVIRRRHMSRRHVVYRSIPLKFSFESDTAMLSNRRFRRMFRLSRNAFWSLRELIQTTRNDNGQGSVRVPVESRLSMALRYLADGSYLDISIAHHVSISTFYYVVDETLTDLDQSLNITFPIDNLEQLKRSSFGFSRGHSPLTGCAGALDGIAIKIFEPCAADAPNPATTTIERDSLRYAFKRSATSTTLSHLFLHNARARLMIPSHLTSRALRSFYIVEIAALPAVTG